MYCIVLFSAFVTVAKINLDTYCNFFLFSPLPSPLNYFSHWTLFSLSLFLKSNLVSGLFVLQQVHLLSFPFLYIPLETNFLLILSSNGKISLENSLVRLLFSRMMDRLD